MNQDPSLNIMDNEMDANSEIKESVILDQKKNGKNDLLKKVAIGAVLLLVVIFIVGSLVKFINTNRAKDQNGPKQATTTKKKVSPTEPETKDSELKQIGEQIGQIDKKSTEIDFSEPIASYPELDMEINFEE